MDMDGWLARHHYFISHRVFDWLSRRLLKSKLVKGTSFVKEQEEKVVSLELATLNSFTKV